MNIGYIRVSSIDQNTDRQLSDIIDTLDNVYIDKASAKNTDREQLQLLLANVKPNDVVHVHSIDRLARNLQDLLQILKTLNSNNITVQFHKENLVFSGSTNNPFQELQLQIIGAVAQFERSMIRERQREGIAKAKHNKSKYQGRKPKLPIERIKAMREQDMTPAFIASQVGASVSSVYRVLAS